MPIRVLQAALYDVKLEGGDGALLSKYRAVGGGLVSALRRCRVFPAGRTSLRKLFRPQRVDTGRTLRLNNPLRVRCTPELRRSFERNWAASPLRRIQLQMPYIRPYGPFPEVN